MSQVPMSRRAFLATAAAGTLVVIGSAGVAPYRAAPAGADLSRCYLGRSQTGVWGLATDAAGAEGGLALEAGVLGILPTDPTAAHRIAARPFGAHPSGAFGVE